MSACVSLSARYAPADNIQQHLNPNETQGNQSQAVPGGTVEKKLIIDYLNVFWNFCGFFFGANMHFNRLWNPVGIHIMHIFFFLV